MMLTIKESGQQHLQSTYHVAGTLLSIFSVLIPSLTFLAIMSWTQTEPLFCTGDIGQAALRNSLKVTQSQVPTCSFSAAKERKNFVMKLQQWWEPHLLAAWWQ